jgi:hypothetical protein
MLLTVWTSILLLQLQVGSVDVCSAMEIPAGEQVRVRGTGGRGSSRTPSEGAVLFDYTCPAAAAPDFVLPAVVLIEAPTFSTLAIADSFRNLTEKSV